MTEAVRGRRKTTRERIVEAALIEFDEQGFEAATVASICRRAGVSNGSFFHAFPSKEAAAGAVFLAALHSYQAALVAAVSGGLSAADGVTALIGAHVRWVSDHWADARFLFLHGQTPSALSTLEALNDSNERFRKALAGWYQPLMDAGALADLPAELLVSQIIGPVQMLCRAWLSGRRKSRPDAHVPPLIACAIRAVVSTGARRREAGRRGRYR